MKHFTSEEKYEIIKQVSNGLTIGIHNFGLLHEIADALDMKNNSGVFLHSISQRITRIMRKLIKEGYPIKEYRIKCCSWSEKETWHPLFKMEERREGE